MEKFEQEKHTLMDVWQDTSLGDGDMTQEFVQLLVVSDGELEVTGDDTSLLVVTGSISSQFEDFGSQVLKNCGEVDGSTSTDSLCVVALPQQTVDTANWEGQTGLGRAARRNVSDAPMTIIFRSDEPHDWAFLPELDLPPDLPPDMMSAFVGGDWDLDLSRNEQA